MKVPEYFELSAADGTFLINSEHYHEANTFSFITSSESYQNALVDFIEKNDLKSAITICVMLVEFDPAFNLFTTMPLKVDIHYRFVKGTSMDTDQETRIRNFNQFIQDIIDRGELD